MPAPHPPLSEVFVSHPFDQPDHPWRACGGSRTDVRALPGKASSLRLALLVCAGLLVSACGGGGDERATAAPAAERSAPSASVWAEPRDGTLAIAVPFALPMPGGQPDDVRRQPLGMGPPGQQPPGPGEQNNPPLGGPAPVTVPIDSHWTPTCEELWSIFITNPTFNMMVRRFQQLSNSGAVLPGEQQQLQEILRWLEKNRPGNCRPNVWWRLVYEPVPNPQPLEDPADDPFCEYKRVPLPVAEGVATGLACYVVWKLCKTAAGTLVGGPVGGGVCLLTP